MYLVNFPNEPIYHFTLSTRDFFSRSWPDASVSVAEFFGIRVVRGWMACRVLEFGRGLLDISRFCYIPRLSLN